MSIIFRNYSHAKDYKRVDDFLITHYQPDNTDGNWIEPIWEYMHGHPYLDSSALEKIGVWEDDEQIVSVSHYESQLGEAFFQFHPAYRYLRKEMFEYAEANLNSFSKKEGHRYLRAYINDNDAEFQSLVRKRSYERDTMSDRPMAKLEISNPFPPITLPDGFQLTSLADNCDWAKVHRVLWRGFDHGDDVPMNDEEFESRRSMFDTPKARRDLKIAVEAPNGKFVAFCGIFYEPTGQFAYVEPVATDPDYRRIGLGKAAVLDGLQRCGELGATVAYVGSDQKFYLSLGFNVIYTSECWVKYLE